MKKVKISDLLVELTLSADEFFKKCEELKIKAPARVKTVTEEEAQVLRTAFKNKTVSLTEVRRGDIVEKRVQSSVIRRRKVDAPPVDAPPKEEEPLQAPSPISAPIESKVESKATPKAAESRAATPLKPRVPKLNVVEEAPKVIETHETKAAKTEKERLAKILLEEEAELARKRRKAFIQKRTEEFDIHGFNRSERIYQPKKKKMSVDRSKMQSTSLTTPKASKRVIKMAGNILVSDLADQLKVKGSELVKKLMMMGSMVTLNQSIDVDTATLLAREFEYEIQNEVVSEKELLKREEIQSAEFKPRPPVVTIMGHVDHGKTTLLDAIRKSDVALGEAGGITQHIGAYMVDIGNGRSITFIDTPGHEAFSAMRARGAKTTDIVILVVAADDGVMPQTKEAIVHAKEANVPIIVAMNKIDKPGAQPERVKKQLSDLDLMSEDWGGKTIYASVSAKNKTGIKELLELILLQADVLELKANPDRLVEGVILEAKMAKGLGPVATVLIQQGTLSKGDILVSGTTFGKVRLLLDDRGKQLKEALPSFAVEVSGLDSVPQVGDHFICFKEEDEARKLVQFRIDQKRQATEKEQNPSEKITLEGLYAKMQEGDIQELKMIVKADVQGSVEVIRQSLEKLSIPKVKMNVIFSMPGAISESDVNLAAASNALIIGFNIRPDVKAQELAKSQKVDIRLYSIIYDLLEDMKKSMVGKLEPTFKESVLGRAEVRNVFKISKVGAIAGCNVVSGKIIRTAQARLLRDSVVIYTGKISSLKRFKDDAKEVLEGYECGICLENYNDIKDKDVIEAFTIQEIAGVLE